MPFALLLRRGRAPRERRPFHSARGQPETNSAPTSVMVRQRTLAVRADFPFTFRSKADGTAQVSPKASNTPPSDSLRTTHSSTPKPLLKDMVAPLMTRRRTVARRSAPPSPLDPVDLSLMASICELPSSGRRSENQSEEHTSELQSRENLVCRLLLEKKNN